ncbi:permease YjgP/YjgQ family protein [Salinisphaera sp. T5B8]|uniref:LPS export ABC transporter permease LptG n=1 Tax=Salinisphaera sp. T5B8 TaxID=1304154 RepID=UPI003340426E
MRIYERYIYAELLRAWVVVNLVLLGLFGFFELAGQLDDVGKGRYTIAKALGFTVEQLPQHLAELTPFAALLTVVIALGLMASRHELVILRGVGLSPVRIAGCVLKAGVALLILVLAVQSFVAPPLMQHAQRMRTAAVAGDSVAGDASYWLRTRDGVVHIARLENGHQPVDIEILEFGPEQTLTRYVRAEKADIQPSGVWKLGGVTVKHPADLNNAGARRAELDWTPSLYDRQLALLDRAPASLAPLSLYRYVAYLDAHNQDAQRYRVALWQKLALPLTTFAMLLLAMPLVLFNPRGANLGLRVALATGIGLGAFALLQAIGNLAFVFGLPAPLCMLTPGLALCGIALLWLRRVG